MTSTHSALRNIVTHPYTAASLRVVLGVIFIYASWDKILHPEAFARSVQNYRILPLESVNLFAIILPWLELVCGVLLCLGLFTGGSILVVALMLAMFFIALSSALLRGIDISCGCFSANSNKSIDISFLIRDMMLLVFAVQALLYDQGVLSFDRLINRRDLK